MTCPAGLSSPPSWRHKVPYVGTLRMSVQAPNSVDSEDQAHCGWSTSHTHWQPQQHCQTVPSPPTLWRQMLSRKMLALVPTWLGPKDQLSKQKGLHPCQLASSEWGLASQRAMSYRENQVRSAVHSPASIPSHLVTKEVESWAQFHRAALMCPRPAGVDAPSYRLPRAQSHEKTLFSNLSLYTDTPRAHMMLS